MPSLVATTYALPRTHYVRTNLSYDTPCYTVICLVFILEFILNALVNRHCWGILPLMATWVLITLVEISSHIKHVPLASLAGLHISMSLWKMLFWMYQRHRDQWTNIWTRALITSIIGVHKVATLCQCHKLASHPWHNGVEDLTLKQVSIGFPGSSMDGSELHSNHIKMAWLRI